MDHMTDDQRSLSAWVHQRDEAAFTTLVERYSGLVRGICQRTTGRADLADEACQGVFLLVSDKAARLAKRPNIAGWLVITARQVAMRSLHAEQRRQRHELLAGAQMNTPDCSHIDDEVLAALGKGLAKLPSAEREAITLRYLLGHEWDEVGSQLQVRRNTAEKRASRGLERLRSWCAKAGVGSKLGSSGLTLALASLTSTVEAASAQPVLEAVVAGESIASSSVIGLPALALAAGTGLAAIAVAVALPLVVAAPTTSDVPNPSPAMTVRSGEESTTAPIPYTLDLRHDPRSHQQLSVSASADGTRMLTVNSAQDELCLWQRTDDGQFQLVSSGIKTGFVAATLSPDGATIAIWGDDNRRQLDLLRWPSLDLMTSHAIDGAQVLYANLAFSADGTAIFAANQGMLTRLDLRTGVISELPVLPAELELERRQLDQQRQEARAVGASAEAGLLDEAYEKRFRHLRQVLGFATGDEGLVTLPLAADGPKMPSLLSSRGSELPQALAEPPRPFRGAGAGLDLLMHPWGGQALALSSGSDGRASMLGIWQLPDGDLLTQAEIPPYRSIACTPDESWLVGALPDGGATVLEAYQWTTGTRRVIGRAEQGLMLDSIGTGDRAQVVGLSQRGGPLYLIDRSLEGMERLELRQQRPAVAGIAIAPDGRIASTTTDGRLHL
jgi:RNA polymerase sigma factor (sigma-70 family)